MVHTVCIRYSILRLTTYTTEYQRPEHKCNRSRARHKIVLEILFQQYVFSRLAKYVLSVVSIRLESHKKILTQKVFQKYYDSIICQTFFYKCILFCVLLLNTGQSSIHYLYYIHYAKRKIELDKDTSATTYMKKSTY